MQRGQDECSGVQLRVKVVTCILGKKREEESESGQGGRREVWFGPEIPGLTQDACHRIIT